MNINAVTAILQELMYQRVNQASPASRVEGATRARDLAAAAQKMAQAAGTSSPAGKTGQVNTEKANEQPLPILDFVPLPLQSELFPGARFFARMREDKTAEQATKEVEEVFICLITEKLGQVWIGLACRESFLSVKCLTEQETSNTMIRENSSPLREELRAIGFSEVSVTSQTRTELGAITEGQLPKFEAHLFDQSV